jgi:hypothetical protein
VKEKDKSDETERLRLQGFQDQERRKKCKEAHRLQKDEREEIHRRDEETERLKVQFEEADSRKTAEVMACDKKSKALDKKQISWEQARASLEQERTKLAEGRAKLSDRLHAVEADHRNAQHELEKDQNFDNQERARQGQQLDCPWAPGQKKRKRNEQDAGKEPDVQEEQEKKKPDQHAILDDVEEQEEQKKERAKEQARQDKEAAQRKRWNDVENTARVMKEVFSPWMNRAWSKSSHLLCCLVGWSVGCLVCWLAGSLVTCNLAC